MVVPKSPSKLILLKKPRMWFKPGETDSAIINDIQRDQRTRERDSKFIYIYVGERKWMVNTGGILFIFAACLFLL